MTEFLSCALNVSTPVKNVRVINKATRCVAVVGLLSKKGKAEIFRNCHELKYYHEKISITDDLSPNERSIFKRKLHKNVKKSQGAAEGDVDIPKPVSRADPVACYPAHPSQEENIEDMSHAYIWRSVEVESK